MKRIYLISFVVVLLISSCNRVQEKQEQDMIWKSDKQTQEQVTNNQDNQEIEFSDDEIQMLEDLLNF